MLQDIDPTTTWFFGSIKPDAGNARIEEKAFAVASYGKQLGLLTEVLIELADKNQDKSAGSAKALADLKRIRNAIEDIKRTEYNRELHDLESRIADVRRKVSTRSPATPKKLPAPPSASEV